MIFYNTSISAHCPFLIDKVFEPLLFSSLWIIYTIYRYAVSSLIRQKVSIKWLSGGVGVRKIKEKFNTRTEALTAEKYLKSLKNKDRILQYIDGLRNKTYSAEKT